MDMDYKKTENFMIKKATLFFSILYCLLSISCASGTALVTGTKRDAITPDEVTIYSELPENYEIIGIVSASSAWGWSQQDSLNYAIHELKKQAAKIGANGIVLESQHKTINGYVYSNGVMIPETAQNVSGKAIFVSDF